MISVVRMTAASARWEAVEGQEPQGTWRCRESRRLPTCGNLEGPLLLLWGWPGEKDTCPRDSALEVTG